VALIARLPSRGGQMTEEKAKFLGFGWKLEPGDAGGGECRTARKASGGVDSPKVGNHFKGHKVGKVRSSPRGPVCKKGVSRSDHWSLARLKGSMRRKNRLRIVDYPGRVAEGCDGKNKNLRR